MLENSKFETGTIGSAWVFVRNEGLSEGNLQRRLGIFKYSMKWLRKTIFSVKLSKISPKTFSKF